MFTCTFILDDKYPLNQRGTYQIEISPGWVIVRRFYMVGLLQKVELLMDNWGFKRRWWRVNPLELPYTEQQYFLLQGHPTDQTNFTEGFLGFHLNDVLPKAYRLYFVKRFHQWLIQNHNKWENDVSVMHIGRLTLPPCEGCVKRRRYLIDRYNQSFLITPLSPTSLVL